MEEGEAKNELYVPDKDDVFMTMVYLVASQSKDQSTHAGAVIVGPDNEIRSTGYNGFVRGLNDYKSERQIRPEKYLWFEHAERNAIYNATLMGVSLKGCKIYLSGLPCMDCARAIVQSGIKEVIADVDGIWPYSPETEEISKKSLEMFGEVGVRVRYYSPKFVDIKKFRQGKEIPLTLS